MKKRYYFVAIVLLLSWIYCLLLCFLVKKDREFSETENRYLSQKPAFSMENFFSGQYTREVESYVNDQFPFRDAWVSFRSDFLQFAGYREINDVYLGEDDYLIEKWLDRDFEEAQLLKNMDAVREFVKRYPEQQTSVMLVPTAGMIYQDKLPSNAPMFDQQVVSDTLRENLSDVTYIDLIPLFLAHNTEELFYKTDHHWTTRGAFLAYEQWCGAKGMTAREEEFTARTLTTEFQGSLYSKVLGTHCAKDKVEIYHREDQAEYCVEYNFARSRSDSVYAMENLQKKDKYQVFFGGNHPEITIRTSQKNQKHLLVLKDSFANAFVPFLLNDYETIHIIDLRYYNGNLDNYILDNCINECLFLYNMKNFCEDKNLYKIGS
ncbi:MAG: DHHW family protein [Acetatifactor sp.]